MFAARSCLCGGLALCSGAVTVTLGRVELGVVCDAAVPLRPHNNEVDRIATAEGATRLDDILTTCSPKSGNKRRPGAEGREASLEVFNVSREFPRVSVLKFSMSGRQDDTLRYKIGCRLPRRLGALVCMGNPDHIFVVDLPAGNTAKRVVDGRRPGKRIMDATAAKRPAAHVGRRALLARSESIDRTGNVDREGACGIIHEEGTEYTASRYPLSV